MSRHPAQNKIFRVLVAALLAFSFTLVAPSMADAEKKKSRSRKNFVPSQQVGKKLLKLSLIHI